MTKEEYELATGQKVEEKNKTLGSKRNVPRGKIRYEYNFIGFKLPEQGVRLIEIEVK